MPIANLIPRRLPLSLSFIPALRLHSIHPLLGLPSPLNPYNTRHIPLHIAVSWYPPTPFLRRFPSNVLRRMRIAFNRDSRCKFSYIFTPKVCFQFQIYIHIHIYSYTTSYISIFVFDRGKKKKRIATSFSSPSWFTAEVNQSRSGGVWKGMERKRERGLDSQKGSAALLQSPMGSQSTDLSSTAAKGWLAIPIPRKIPFHSARRYLSTPLSILYTSLRISGLVSMTKDDGSTPGKHVCWEEKKKRNSLSFSFSVGN